jgi:hypothetical protein
MVSADILDYPDLFGLLDAVRDAGKELVLGSPGLRLADRAFVERLAAYPVSIDLTYLATDDATYNRIVGNQEARAAIDAGLAHLVEVGVPFKVGVVVTSLNVHAFPDVVAHLAGTYGVDRIVVRLFYPDLEGAPDEYFDLFPDYQEVQEALEALERSDVDPLPELDLGNAPLCQLDLRGFERLRLVPREHHAHQNTFKTDGLPACATCAVRDRCVRVHMEYMKRHRIRPVDDAVIAQTLELAHSAEARRTEVQQDVELGIPKEEGLLPGEGTPRSQGILPGQGIPKGQGVPKGQGILPGQGIPKGQGVPKDEGTPPVTGDD